VYDRAPLLLLLLLLLLSIGLLAATSGGGADGGAYGLNHLSHGSTAEADTWRILTLGFLAKGVSHLRRVRDKDL
jgi:hypothetical protein